MRFKMSEFNNEDRISELEGHITSIYEKMDDIHMDFVVNIDWPQLEGVWS